MSAKQYEHPFRIPFSRRRRDRAFAFSLAASLLFHALAAAGLILLADQPRAHVFLLVESGEEAVEMEIGGLSATPARPREIAERRFGDEADFPPPEKRRAPVVDERASDLAFLNTTPESVSWEITREQEARRPRRETEPETPPEKEPLALEPPPPAMTAAVGGASLPRGVRQRARPAGTLVPRYPVGSRRRGESGVVTVRAHIGVTGACQWARVETSSGYAALDAAALDTVRRAAFQPAREDGLAVAAEERFAIEFRLR